MMNRRGFRSLASLVPMEYEIVKLLEPEIVAPLDATPVEASESVIETTTDQTEENAMKTMRADKIDIKDLVEMPDGTLNMVHRIDFYRNGTRRIHVANSETGENRGSFVSQNDAYLRVER